MKYIFCIIRCNTSSIRPSLLTPDLVSPPPVDRLNQKDALVVHALTEKLQLFAEMAETTAGLEDTASRSRLLLRGDASDLQQGEALLKGAITEGRGGGNSHTLKKKWVVYISEYIDARTSRKSASFNGSLAVDVMSVYIE